VKSLETLDAIVLVGAALPAKTRYLILQRWSSECWTKWRDTGRSEARRHTDRRKGFVSNIDTGRSLLCSRYATELGRTKSSIWGEHCTLQPATDKSITMRSCDVLDMRPLRVPTTLQAPKHVWKNIERIALMLARRAMLEH
jgi:hypothetical protein